MINRFPRLSKPVVAVAAAGVCAFLTGVSARGADRAPAAPASRPNIIIILADDLGYADVGFQGCRDIPTPNIDSLAATGVRCTSGYAAHPFCSPTRASLMTGRYQHRFGYENNIAYDPQDTLMGLPLSQKTIPQRLKQAGYATGMVGKWHLGAAHLFHPNHRGFDFFYGFLGGGHDYFQVTNHKPMGEGYFSPLDRNGTPTTFPGYLTDALTTEAVGFIEANQDRPFFLYAAYNAPHTPLQAPAEKIAKFSGIADKKRRLYAAMVNCLDDGVGRILATLERLGLRENTLVCFLSDNGGPTSSNASRNDPLRGAKGSVFEGGIRVPFVLSWPARLPRGVRYGRPVISHDLSVTALKLAGLPVAKIPELDGVNLIPFLTGARKDAPHARLAWRMGGGRAWAVRVGEWKLLQTGGDNTPSLYHLSADIGETDNRAAAQAAAVRELRDAWQAWNAPNLPPFFPGYRDYHQAKNAFYKTLISPPAR